MPPSPSSAEESRTRRVLGYASAVVLSLLAAWFTVSTPALHGIPFALISSVIAGIGVFAGPGPALLAICIFVASVRFPFSPFYQQVAFNTGQIERSLVLLAAAFFLIFLIWRQRATERKLRAALATLQERTDALAQAQQASELATWVYNVHAEETLWDEGSTLIFGRPFSEFGKTFPMHLVVEEDRIPIRDAFIKADQEGQPLRIEFRVTWPDGEIHWLAARGFQVSRSPNLWRGVTFDVTRRKNVEAALIYAEKLAAMGRLASTIAHEVNNPLESVTNLLYIAGQDPSLSDDSRQYLSLAEEELARLGNITRLTLSFSRTAGVVRTPIPVADVIDSVLALFQRRCEVLNICVERFYTDGVEIEILQHELRQILINLIANAIDALTTENPRLCLHTLNHTSRAVILVEDNGSGIELHDQERIFDAFFTTKTETGTGIGLWVTRELVEKNGGIISVESGDHMGNIRTRFRLEFPAAAKSQ